MIINCDMCVNFRFHAIYVQSETPYLHDHLVTHPLTHSLNWNFFLIFDKRVEDWCFFEIEISWSFFLKLLIKLQSSWSFWLLQWSSFWQESWRFELKFLPELKDLEAFDFGASSLLKIFGFGGSHHALARWNPPNRGVRFLGVKRKSYTTPRKTCSCARFIRLILRRC